MLTSDFSNAERYLGLMLERLSNLEPALAKIGAHQRETIQRRIQRTKQTPDGEDWAPWRPFTRAKREAKGNAGQGLLWDDGTLLESILAESGEHHVTIGTDVPYAGYLQDGTPKMAAREFIGWTLDDQITARDTLIHWIEGIA
jgi:phage virion morphogenesis protein